MTIGTDDTQPRVTTGGAQGRTEQRLKSLEARAKEAHQEIHGGPGGLGLKTGQARLQDAHDRVASLVEKLDHKVEAGFGEMRAFAQDMRTAQYRDAPWVWGVFGAILGGVLVLLAYFVIKALGGG